MGVRASTDITDRMSGARLPAFQPSNTEVNGVVSASDQNESAGARDGIDSVKAEAGYSVLIVRWHKSVDAFDPAETLISMAESHGYPVKHRAGKNPGRTTLRIDTEESARRGKRRKPQLVSREARSALNKLLRAAMRDERLAPSISALVTRSQSGEDVSKELIEKLSELKTPRGTDSSVS
jgi:hypothetical protein